jgi:hypothetical protein
MSVADDLERLSRVEGRCTALANTAVSCLLDMSCRYGEKEHKIFYVNMTSEKDSGEPSLSCGLSIVIRETMRAEVFAKDVIGEIENWNVLREEVRSSFEALIDNENLYEALPLRSLGILPSFSTFQLAEAIGSSGNPPPSSYNSLAYKIALRKAFIHISGSSSTFLNMNIVDENNEHLLLLYRAISAARGFTLPKLRDQKSGSKVKFDLFFNASMSRIVSKIAKQLRKKDGKKPSKDEVKNLKESLNKSLVSCLSVKKISSGKSPTMTLVNTLFNKHLSDLIWQIVNEEAEELYDRIIESALRELEHQLLNKYENPATVDPSTLVSCLGIIQQLDSSKNNKSKYSSKIVTGLKTLFENCYDGLFHSVKPFFIDANTRSMYMSSVEIAGIALDVVEQYQGYFSLKDLGFIVDVCEKILNKCDEHQNTIKLKKNEPRETTGWCTDRASSDKRIDSWVTSLSLSFFLKYTKLLRHMRNTLVLTCYTSKKSSECFAWDELVEPRDSQPFLKEDLISWIDDSKNKNNLAPTLLLYGPPGTSKTTIAEAVANRWGYDFISLSPSDFISGSMDAIESTSREIFKQLTKMHKCVILFDEMDSLFRDRTDLANKEVSNLEMIVPAFLPKLQTLRDCSRAHNLIVFLATNYKEKLDGAIIRKGRIDHQIFVHPYDKGRKKELLLRKSRSLCDCDAENTAKNLDSLAESFLEKQPVFLVYREIEVISRDFVRFIENESVSGSKTKPSTVAELYDPKTRKNARVEFEDMLTRIARNHLNQEIELSDSIINDFLQKVDIELIRDKYDLVNWIKVARHWQTVLADNNSSNRD